MTSAERAEREAKTALAVEKDQAMKGRKGNTQVQIRVDSEEDIVTYTLDVFSNGSTSIDVTARNRESISYSGQIEVEE